MKQLVRILKLCTEVCNWYWSTCCFKFCPSKLYVSENAKV